MGKNSGYKFGKDGGIISKAKNPKNGTRQGQSPEHFFISTTGKVYNRISGTAAQKQVYNQYFYKACDRGLVWELDAKDFFRLTQANCYYCGQEPDNKHCRANLKEPYIYNGIDRLDNNHGYTRANTVTSCKTCNIFKRNLIHDEFLSRIKKIYTKLFIPL